jgi:hypothetical protein
MTKTAHCNLESLERLKILSDEISAKEAKEAEDRKELVGRLEKVCGMLENVKMTKKRVLEEIKLIINNYS